MLIYRQGILFDTYCQAVHVSVFCKKVLNVCVFKLHVLRYLPVNIPRI